MAETEAGVRARIAAITLLEREHVSAAKRAHHALDVRLSQVEKRQVVIDLRAKELEASDVEIKARRKQFTQEMEANSARLSLREDSMRRLESHVRGQFFLVERRQAELTGENEDLHDRLRVMRAERAEYEARETEVKQRDLELKGLIETQRTKRAQLFVWEEQLQRRCEQLDVHDAKLQERLAKLKEKESEIAARIARVVTAERGLGERVAAVTTGEQGVARREAIATDREARLAERERAVEARAVDVEAQLALATDERAEAAGVRRTARADAQSIWTMAQDVRQGIAELEQRQRTIRGMLKGPALAAMHAPQDGGMWTAAVHAYQQTQMRKVYLGGAGAAGRAGGSGAGVGGGVAAALAADSASSASSPQREANRMQLDEDIESVGREVSQLLARLDALHPADAGAVDRRATHFVATCRGVDASEDEQHFFLQLLSSLAAVGGPTASPRGADHGGKINNGDTRLDELWGVVSNRALCLRQQRLERLCCMLEVLRMLDATGFAPAVDAVAQQQASSSSSRAVALYGGSPRSPSVVAAATQLHDDRRGYHEDGDGDGDGDGDANDDGVAAAGETPQSQQQRRHNRPIRPSALTPEPGDTSDAQRRRLLIAASGGGGATSPDRKPSPFGAAARGDLKSRREIERKLSAMLPPHLRHHYSAGAV